MPSGGGGPFEDLMRNLARLLTSQGPLNWEIARQMAQWASTGGEAERNPDPVARVRIEELLRVAELHVGEATGLPVSAGGLLTRPGGHAAGVGVAHPRRLEAAARAAGRHRHRVAAAGIGWARPGGRGRRRGRPRRPHQLDGPARRHGAGRRRPAAPGAASIRWPSCSAICRRCWARSCSGCRRDRWSASWPTGPSASTTCPMPRPPRDELMLVTATIDTFAEDWSLAADDVRLWVCLREATYNAVLGRPHVRARLDRLIGDYVGAFHPNPQSLEDRLSQFDPTDPSALQAAFGDPETLLGELQTDEQRRLQVPLRVPPGGGRRLRRPRHGHRGPAPDRIVRSVDGGPAPPPAGGERRNQGPRADVRGGPGRVQPTRGGRRSSAASSNGPVPRAWTGCGGRSGSCPRRPSSTRRACGWPESICPTADERQPATSYSRRASNL